MNWLQKLSQEEEHIVEAVVYIDGQLFSGPDHGSALNKALSAGAISLNPPLLKPGKK